MSRVHEQASVFAAIQRVKSKFRNVKDGKLTLVNTKDGLVFLTKFQSVERLRPEDPLDRVIYDAIMSHAYKAEKVSPGGFDSCLCELLEYSFDHGCGNPNIDNLRLTNDTVKPGVSPGTMDDINWLFDQYSMSRDIRELVMTAVELAGFAGHICVEKSVSDVLSVESTRGFVFDVKPAFPVKTTIKHPKIVCVDGYVESVAEVHHLLQRASDDKVPCVFFARGMNNDVLSTLKTNYDRGTLTVIPVIVQFDLAGINSLNDIAIVSGTDVVSSNKGQLISSIDVTTLPIIDRIDIQQSRLTLFNTRSVRAVKTHLHNLREKRARQNVSDVSSLLDARIKSLLSNHTVIRIPDDMNYVITAQAIDCSLRAFKALVDYGTVTVNGNKTLTSTTYAAAVYAHRCREMLTTLGAVVV